MPNKLFTLVLLAIVFAVAACRTAATRVQQHASEEWVSLFNGRDLTGWTIKMAGYKAGENHGNTYRVQDSMISVDYSQVEKFDGAFGHLYYHQPYSHYRLRLQYRFTGRKLPDGPGFAHLNSGVMLHAQPAASVGLNQSFPVSLEMQFLASDDTVSNNTGNLCTPGTIVHYNGVPSDDHCISSTSPNFRAGQWMNAEAIVLGDSIIYHLIEGDTVLQYTQMKVGGGFVHPAYSWTHAGFGADSVAWIAQSGKPLGSGHIALQAESQPVQFRKIMLLNLEGCMDPKATNYKPYYVKADNSTCRY